jgi:hypothetical protein
MVSASARLDQRRLTHKRLATRLAALSEAQLVALLDQMPDWHFHVHGGQSGTIKVEGVKVFVKKIALTDLERREENRGSTANLFDLPGFYQYGIGSAGFGAWRELAAYERASGWALSGACPHFPLLYHQRVLPRTTRPASAEQQERRDWLVNYWDRSDAVRERIDAIAAASASIVLFLEHVPETLHAWLGARSASEGPDVALEADILRICGQLRDTAGFLNDHGMLHFDLHAHNVLTDGEQIHVADFGLALCKDFELSPAERGFFEAHRLYDRGYVDWVILEWVAPGGKRPALSAAMDGLLDRCAPAARVFEPFFKALREESKHTPYPAEELAAALGV